MGIPNSTLKDPPNYDKNYTYIDPGKGYYALNINNSTTTDDLNKAYALNQISLPQTISIKDQLDLEKKYLNGCEAIISFQYGELQSCWTVKEKTNIEETYEKSYFTNIEKVFNTDNSGLTVITVKIVWVKTSNNRNYFTLQQSNHYGPGKNNNDEKYLTHCVSDDELVFNSDSKSDCGLVTFTYDGNGYITQMKIYWNDNDPDHNVYIGKFDNVGFPIKCRDPPRDNNLVVRLTVVKPNEFMTKYFKYTRTNQGALDCVTETYPRYDNDIQTICSSQELKLGTNKANSFINDLISSQYLNYRSQIKDKYCQLGNGVNCDTGYYNFCSNITDLNTYPECGCFMPSTYMNNYWTSILKILPPDMAAKFDRTTECFFYPCVSSTVKNYRLNNGKVNCPSQVNTSCFQNIQMDIKGTVTNSNINASSLAQCSGSSGGGTVSTQTPVSPIQNTNPSSSYTIYIIVGVILCVICVIYFI